MFFFSFDVFSCGGNKVNMADGINYIDLNGDGKKDMLVYAKFDNNTTHPSQTLTIFMKNKNNKYIIVPLPNDDGFTWYDFKLSASEMKTQDYELKIKEGAYYMIYSKKRNGNDIFGKYPVEFTRYDIKYNNEDAGISTYYWDYTHSYVTKNKYNNVSDAVEEYNARCKL
jgi:hypothetical protein